jgi:POT family proton-dependent oligopeptide transporter
VADAAAAPTIEVPNTHPIGFYYIVLGEFAERCSYYGVTAILSKYMSKELGFGEANAGTMYALFTAGCYFLPLLGGYIADNFFGKYWTIVGFSVPYIVGQVLVGFPSQYAFFCAVPLLMMGSGVVKPNVSTLMGMTYDQQRPGKDQLRSSAFAYFYAVFNIGAGLGQFAVPEIKDSHGYQLAFTFPAVFMVLAFFGFAMGKKHYAKEVIVRKKLTKEEWRERMQLLGRVGVLFLPLPFFWAAYYQTGSTWVFFGETYSHEVLFGTKITAEQLQWLNAALIVLLTPVLRFVFKTLADRGIVVRPVQKLLFGFVFMGIACLCLSVAGGLAGTAQEITVIKDGKDVLERVPLPTEQTVTLWWMVLAYFFLTIGELLVSVTGLEFAFIVAPEKMKGFMTALFLLTIWAGNLFVNAPISRLYAKMDPSYYFGLLTVLVIIAGVAYAAIARKFEQKMGKIV